MGRQYLRLFYGRVREKQYRNNPSSAMKDIPTASERLATVLRACGLPSLNSLARRLGLKRCENLYQIRRGNYGISEELARKIHDLYPQFSVSWLVLGLHEERPEVLSYTYDTTIRIMPLYFSLKKLKEQPAFPYRIIQLTAGLCPSARYAALTDSHECGTIETILLLCDREGEPDEELGKYKICGSITCHL